MDDQSSAQAANAYDYGNGNPVLYADPTGLFGWHGITHAASRAAKWVDHHKKQIGSAVVGTVVAIGVGVAIGATCATVVGCIALGVGVGVGVVSGAASSGASYGVDVADGEVKNPSWKGFLTSVGIGAVAGGITGGLLGGVGKVFGSVLESVAGRLASGATSVAEDFGGALGKLASGVRSAGRAAEDGATPGVGEAPKPVAPGSSTASGGSTSTIGASGGTGAAEEGGPALTRVGRWMSPAEHDAMSATGTVQEGAGGVTNVAHPADVESYMRQAAPGTRYVEFDVPENSLVQGGKEGWATIPGPNSIFSRLNAQRGLAPFEFPGASSIEWLATKLPPW